MTEIIDSPCLWPGFRIVGSALFEFEQSRLSAVDPKRRYAQSQRAREVFRQSLVDGALVVFILAETSRPERIPAYCWRAASNYERLFQCDLDQQTPFKLDHPNLSIEGVALLDEHNWAGILKWADRWPEHCLDARVRLLMRFCEAREEIGQGHPIPKGDAVTWFRYNWPRELDDLWSYEDRFKKDYGNGMQCPPIVSAMADCVLMSDERTGKKIIKEVPEDVRLYRKRHFEKMADEREFELHIQDDDPEATELLSQGTKSRPPS